MVDAAYCICNIVLLDGRTEPAKMDHKSQWRVFTDRAKTQMFVGKDTKYPKVIGAAIREKLSIARSIIGKNKKFD